MEYCLTWGFRAADYRILSKQKNAANILPARIIILYCIPHYLAGFYLCIQISKETGMRSTSGSHQNPSIQKRKDREYQKYPDRPLSNTIFVKLLCKKAQVIRISVSQTTSAVNYPVRHKVLPNIDPESIGQIMVLTPRLWVYSLYGPFT